MYGRGATYSIENQMPFQSRQIYPIPIWNESRQIHAYAQVCVCNYVAACQVGAFSISYIFMRRSAKNESSATQIHNS